MATCHQVVSHPRPSLPFAKTESVLVPAMAATARRHYDNIQLQAAARDAFVGFSGNANLSSQPLCPDGSLTATYPSPAEPGGQNSTVAPAIKRQKRAVVPPIDPFHRVAKDHRPGDSQAGELFDRVIQPFGADAGSKDLIEGALWLLKEVAPGELLTEPARLAIVALLALFQAVRHHVVLGCVEQGSLIFQLRLPRDKAVALLDRVTQRPSQLVDLRIRSMGFLITNQCDIVRLDDCKGVMLAALIAVSTAFVLF